MSLVTLDFKRPDNKKSEFEIIEIPASNIVNIPSDHHRHSFYEILVVEEGVSRQVVDFKTFSVEANEILIIPKNSVHKTLNGEYYKGLLLLFTDSYLNQEQNHSLQLLSIFNPLSGNNLISIEHTPELKQYLELLKSEYNKNEEQYLLIQNLLFCFLLKLELIAKQYHTTNRLPSDQNIYLSFITSLENNFTQEHSVTFYAQALNVSTKKLNALLKQIRGKTTSDVITERIIIEAKRLLVYSEHSVKEIAYKLGFEDNHYFSRLFKQQVLLSPELFRKSVAEKSTTKS